MKKVTKGTEIASLRVRVAELERRLDPVAECGTLPDVLDMLERRRPEGAPYYEPIADLASGHLRPATFAQMQDCLAEVAWWVHNDLISSVADIEDQLRRQARSTSV